MKNTVSNNTAITSIKHTDKEQTFTDNKIKNLKIRIGKHPSTTKVFYLYYSIKGRKFKYRIDRCRTIGLTSARVLAEQLMAKVALGINPATVRSAELADAKQAQASTLRIYLDEHYYPHSEIHQRDHAQSKNLLERVFKDHMKKQVSDITPKLIDSWRNKELDRGISPQTLNTNVNISSFSQISISLLTIIIHY